MTGIFYGVGVGPGDPELLTLKAVRTIREADVIIAPKTEKKNESTALNIARPHLSDKTEILKLVFPMVNDNERLAEAWEYNKNIILEQLKLGKKVVFLTLGDPMFYSTYIYVFRLLQDSGYPIETVPGITAFCAMGSKLGIPLAEGDDVMSVIPATASEEIVDKALATSDRLVLMKVYRNFPEIVRKLEEYGLAKDAVMISNCGMPDETIRHDLSQASSDKVSYFSTILARKAK